MKVLLLGATGLLGRHLADRLPRTLTVCAPQPRAGEPEPLNGLHWLTRRLDAADHATLEPVLDEACADLIVNTIAVIAADVAPASRDLINGVFPHQLAAAADRRGARVIHVSTDCVFSGAVGGYRESDVPDPNDAYGRSKLAGEPAAPHVTIRTSFFGANPRGAGLIAALLARRGGSIEGFTDYRFTGVSAVLAADLIATAIETRPPLEGVYHVGGDPITKFELLQRAAAHLELEVRVVPVARGRVDRTLDSSRFFAAIGRRRPSLHDSLETLTRRARCSSN